MALDRVYSFTELMGMVFEDDVIVVLPDYKTKRPSQASQNQPSVKDVNDGLIQLMAAEMEKVREAFLDFQTAIENYAIAPFLSPAIDMFASECISLTQVIANGNDNASHDELLTEMMASATSSELDLRKQIYGYFIKKYLDKGNI